MTDVVFKEYSFSLDGPVSYTIEEQTIKRKWERKSVTRSLFQTIICIFREMLLPSGYPNSVSEDYFQYQLWDTLQAFCSTITGIFTTQAILQGVGVGNKEATALSATLTWVIKDGTGMIGGILFAWAKGSSLDRDCKKWRLFADVLNDAAMLLELSLPFMNEASMQILCISTLMKSVVGVVGGATRAAITNHQARKGNMAEISAKDRSQETVVNLAASFAGIALLNSVTNSTYQWSLVIFLVMMHIFANYKAVSSLIFTSLNSARLSFILNSYLSESIVHEPVYINQKESVFFHLKKYTLWKHKIILGESLRNVMPTYSAKNFRDLTDIHQNHKYLIVPDLKNDAIFVAFHVGEDTKDVIAAFFEAVLFSIALEIHSNVNYSKKFHKSSPISRLQEFLSSYPKNEAISNRIVPFRKFIKEEFSIFVDALLLKGYELENHTMDLNEWRAEWNLNKKLS